MLERAFEMNEELYQTALKKGELYGEDSDIYKMCMCDWETSNRLFAELFGFKDVHTFIDAQCEHMNKIK